MQSVEKASKTWPGAVIVVTQDDAISYRPAAFVFDVPGGLAWVEPSYADPAGAGTPALHVRRGEFLKAGILRGDRWRVDVVPYAAAEDTDLIGDALDWFAGYLKAAGRTWDQERERVRVAIAPELAQ